MICETGQFPLAETCNARRNFSKSFKRDGEIDSREKIDERLKERSWRDAIDERRRTRRKKKKRRKKRRRRTRLSVFSPRGGKKRAP